MFTGPYADIELVGLALQLPSEIRTKEHQSLANRQGNTKQVWSYTGRDLSNMRTMKDMRARLWEGFRSKTTMQPWRLCIRRFRDS
jgi:hypothetical protein